MNRRGIVGLVVVAAGVAELVATFLPWMTTPMAGGGSSGVSGWGTISGGAPGIAGSNLNDVINALTDGHPPVGAYRPAVLALIAALVAIIAGVGIAVTRSRTRPATVVAAVAIAAGLVGVGWALAKVIDPGDALGVLPSSQVHPGSGPIVAVCAAALVAAGGAASLLRGPASPKLVARRRGQSRR